MKNDCLAPLSSVADIISGFAFKSTWFGVGSDKIIRIGDLVDCNVSLKKAMSFDSSDHFVPQRYRIRSGDILVALSGATVGKIGVALDDAVGSYVNQRVAVVRGQNTDQQSYLSFILRSEYMLKLLTSAEGAAQPNLSPKHLSNLLVPLPHADDQRRIAAQLKAQLAEVEKARKLATLQLVDAILLESRVLFEIFKEVENDPREVISDWAETTSGSTPARGNKEYWSPADIPWVRTAEVVFNPILQTEECISSKALKECSVRLLPPKTVLIAMYGQGKTRGQSAILEVAATTNQACFAILPNKKWLPEFMQLWLQKSYLELRSLSESRGGNQANLNGGILKALKVSAPTVEKQSHIVLLANEGLKEVAKIKKACMDSLRDIECLPQKILSEAFGDGDAS